MNNIVKLAAAGGLALLIHSPANAVIVTGTGNGSFSNEIGCTGGNCGIIDNNGGDDNRIYFGGSNPSYITANPRSFSFDLTTPQNDREIGRLTWVNNETTGGTTNPISFTYTFNLNFSAPFPGSSDSESFSLTFTQPTNPPGDIVSGLTIAAGPAGLGPLVFGGISVSDIHFSLLSPIANGESFTNGLWKNPENNTSQLILTGDFSVAAVPEPTTWALMMIGFCGVSLMAYHRRRSLVPRGVSIA